MFSIQRIKIAVYVQMFITAEI